MFGVTHYYYNMKQWAFNDIDRKCTYIGHDMHDTLIWSAVEWRDFGPQLPSTPESRQDSAGNVEGIVAYVKCELRAQGFGEH